MTPGQLHRQGRRTGAARLNAPWPSYSYQIRSMATQIHHLQGQPAGRRHRPRLLRRPCLTLARHPSETDERMMVRLAALALQAHQLQTVCNGDGTWPLAPACPTRTTRMYCCVTSPAAPPVDRSGPARRQALIKACGKADEVVVYCFNHAAEVWWRGIETKLTRPAEPAGLAHAHRGLAGLARWPSAACSCRPPSRKAC
jgi:hypothetical protein